MPSPRTATVIADATGAVDGVDPSGSDDAQQASACAWVKAGVAPPSPSECAIGHDSPLLQHAIRASGVAAQPAQTPKFPAISNTVSSAAEQRRAKITTRSMRETHATVKP